MNKVPVTKCSKRHKLLFGFFKIRDKHQFIISNAFYILEDPNRVDVVKTCQDCGIKEVLLLNRDILVELIVKFPNAFTAVVRGYLQTWIR